MPAKRSDLLVAVGDIGRVIVSDKIKTLEEHSLK